MDWITQVIAVINSELGHQTAIRALIAGFLMSAFGTQYIKRNSPQLDGFNDVQARWWVRAFAFFTAMAFTWMLWPEPGLPGIAMGIVMGFATPLLYVILVRTLVHFWPWLDAKISARPKAGPMGGAGDGAGT